MHPGCRWAWLTTTYYGLHFFHFDGEDPVNDSIVDAYKEEFLKKHKFRATLMERCSDDALSYMGAPHEQIQSYRDNGRVPTQGEMVAWGSDSSVPFKCNEFREECVDEDVDPQETGIDTTRQAPLQNLPYEYAWERSMLDPLHVLGHQYDNCKAPLMGNVAPKAPKTITKQQ
eukprot:Nk52_evm1s527 gene=Nk52_evmTU1s527